MKCSRSILKYDNLYSHSYVPITEEIESLFVNTWSKPLPLSYLAIKNAFGAGSGTVVGFKSRVPC